MKNRSLFLITFSKEYQMDLCEYLEWRQEFLSNPVGRPLQTPRGSCVVGKSFTLDWVVRDNWHLRNRQLEDAEFELIYHGKDMDPYWKDRLYGDDEELYQAYKSLRIATSFHSWYSHSHSALSLNLSFLAAAFFLGTSFMVF